MTMYNRRLSIDTQRMVAAAADSAKLQLRPYMGIEKCTQSSFPRGQDGTYVISTNNVGATHAKDVSWTGKAVLAAWEFEKEIDSNITGLVAELVDTDWTLHPGASKDLYLYPVALSHEELAQVASGSHALFLFGLIRYRDHQNNIHFTRFAFVDEDKVDGSKRISHAEFGNSAT